MIMTIDEENKMNKILNNINSSEYSRTEKIKAIDDFINNENNSEWDAFKEIIIYLMNERGFSELPIT